MASATAGAAPGALTAAQDAATFSNGRTSADYASGGGTKKKKASGGGRHVATPAGSSRYHLPIGAPLGKGKSADHQASYDAFLASDKKSDMTRNATNMSNADLTKSAEAVFSVKTDNARNQAAQDVLVHELAARGIDPHKYGYTGGPVVVSPNPKADPTVTAQNKVQKAAAATQKAADTAAKKQQAQVAKDAAAAAKAQATAQKTAAAQQKTAAAQQAAAAKQAAAQAAQAAQAAHAAQIQAARDAAAKSLIQGTETNAQLQSQWQQILGTKKTVAGPGAVTAGVWAAIRHPRDAHGRFINVGDIVHGDGVSGKVEGTSKGGKVQVKEASGAIKEVDGKKLQKLANGHGDAVKGLDHATKGLLQQTDKALGKPSAPKAPNTTRDKHGKPVTHGDAVVVKPNDGHFGGAFTGRVDKIHDDGSMDVAHLKTGETHKVGSHQAMSLGSKAPAAPKAAAPKAVDTPSAPKAEAPTATKEGHELAQGDHIHAYGADGSKKTLKVEGVAKSDKGHTVTATDTASGQQHTIAVNHGAKVETAAPAAPAAPAAAVPPLDEAQLQQRIAAVESQVKAAVDGGLSTDAQFSLDGKGQVWEPERAKQHNAIVNDLYAKAANVPNNGQGLFSGGLGGAGKTTTLKNPKTGIDQSQFLTINPDDIKEIMAERGMIPEIPGEVKLSPMEKVALIHEESSYIANLLAQRAYADKKNVTWDITMASEGSVAKRIAEMKKNGYTNLDAVFVDIPVEGSVKRALARYQRGMEDYRNGKGAGGRYVPPSVIRKNASTSFSSANRANFEKLRDQFDNWQVWDNSVDKRDPRLVYSKTTPDLPSLTAEAAKGLTDADKGVSP